MALEFPQYDAKVAAGLEGAAGTFGGLIGFLDIRHTEVGPGLLRAEVDVRDELKTPFGNLHGGVLAALCDHVLGTVMYPVIRVARGPPPRSSRSTTSHRSRRASSPRPRAIVSLTKRTAVVRIDVENGERLVSAAQGTVLVMPPKAQ